MGKITASRMRVLEEPIRRYTMGRIPHLDSEWRSLADDFLEWAMKKDSMHLRDFATLKGYSWMRFKSWGKHHEYFATALEIARQIVCSRREKAAEKGKLAIPLFLSSFGMYDPEYRESIMHENSHRNSQITVIEEPIEDTGIPFPKDSHE